MKKLLIILLMMALFVPMTGMASAAEPTTLTFWTFAQSHHAFMESAAQRWNETYPDRPIELKAETQEYAGMHQNLTISLQSGSGAPDIVDIEIAQYTNYITSEEEYIPLIPLNDIIEPDKENLIMGRFDNYANHGNYYGIDYHVGATALMYNRDLFAEAGINIEDINTWADFVEAGKVMKEKTGKYIFAVETTDLWTYYPLITEQGSDFFDRETGEVIMDNQINIDTLQWLLDGIKEGYFVAVPGGDYHEEQWYGYMNEGNVASIAMPLWYLNRFTDFMPDLKGKMDVTTMPVWEEGQGNSAGLGGTGTSITNQCQNVELAKEFLYFAKLSREGAIRTWTELGFDPLRTDIYNDAEMTAPNTFTDFFSDNIYKVMDETSTSIFGLSNTNALYPEAQSLAMNTVMYEVLVEQSKTPEESLKGAADQLRSQQ
ncbi:MAG: extracellular solute-binding protein [Clostridiales bacterium]|nr:extracellular solute-binding protein [Clostridiales bacterium]